MQTQLSPKDMDELRHLLLGGEPFIKLATHFIDSAVKETGADDANFKEFYKIALQAVTEENAAEIERSAGSPIEKTFLNSLVLSFIRGDGLGLLVHPTFKDTPNEIGSFREDLKSWQKFFAWFRANKPANSVDEFLDQEMARGQMCADERRSYPPAISGALRRQHSAPRRCCWNRLHSSSYSSRKAASIRQISTYF